MLTTVDKYDLVPVVKELRRFKCFFHLCHWFSVHPWESHVSSVYHTLCLVN